MPLVLGCATLAEAVEAAWSAYAAVMEAIRKVENEQGWTVNPRTVEVRQADLTKLKADARELLFDYFEVYDLDQRARFGVN